MKKSKGKLESCTFPKGAAKVEFQKHGTSSQNLTVKGKALEVI